MQVNKNNITQYLTATNMSFMIPVYQRNYDWKEENCKQLWNDIWYISQSPSSKTHFLGTVCSKTFNGHEKTIIDGQQRITTVTLLMKAMHDYVDNEVFKNDIDSNFLHNNGYGVSPNHKVKLHLNRRDDEVYNKLLSNREYTPASKLSPSEASSRIYQNYNYFYEAISGLDECQVADVRSALDRIVIVDLDVEGENPQEIFESLNSTGLDLTDVDLLRNFLLMSLDYETQVRLYDDYWFGIEENVRADNMVRFFIDYLIFVRKSDALMLRGRRAHINENNLYQAFKDHYASLVGKKERYESSSEVTELILKDMLGYSEVYRDLVFDDGIDMNALDDAGRVIYSIVSLNQAVASRPVLLYVMDKYHRGLITTDQMMEMLNACLSLVFRAKVSGTTGINSQFAGNILRKLPEDDYDNLVDAFWGALASGSEKFAFPSDRMFFDALVNRQIFEVLRARGTKYLLYVLEQNSPAAKGLPRYDDMNTTIEHVMPKTLSEGWQDVLGDDAIHHDDYLNKLGNLALTSNNAEMSNGLFSEKGDWYAESSFFYTRDLLSYDDWGPSQIRRRGRKLAQRCVEIWSFPSKYQSEKSFDEESCSKRRSNFKFSMIGLRPGEEISYIHNPSRVATVYDDTHVLYDGTVYTLSRLAAVLLGKANTNGVSGPLYFLYKGETLAELRNEVEGGL